MYVQFSFDGLMDWTLRYIELWLIQHTIIISIFTNNNHTELSAYGKCADNCGACLITKIGERTGNCISAYYISWNFIISGALHLLDILLCLTLSNLALIYDPRLLKYMVFTYSLTLIVVSCCCDLPSCSW